MLIFNIQVDMYNYFWCLWIQLWEQEEIDLIFYLGWSFLYGVNHKMVSWNGEWYRSFNQGKIILCIIIFCYLIYFCLLLTRFCQLFLAFQFWQDHLKCPWTNCWLFKLSQMFWGCLEDGRQDLNLFVWTIFFL